MIVCQVIFFCKRKKTNSGRNRKQGQKYQSLKEKLLHTPRKYFKTLKEEKCSSETQ